MINALLHNIMTRVLIFIQLCILLHNEDSITCLVNINTLIKNDMKTLALDMGDVWVGTALSDALGITAKPYETSTYDKLIPFLTTVFSKEMIATVVVGYPKTMHGNESEQTKKIVSTTENLQKKFPDKEWVLWDERLSSKRAAQLKSTRSKEEKIKSHSIAAAFILSSYLDHQAFKKSLES